MTGVSQVRLIVLHWFYASIEVSAGANVKALENMLGHKSAAMTLDTYADLFDSDLDALGENINAKIPDLEVAA